MHFYTLQQCACPPASRDLVRGEGRAPPPPTPQNSVVQKKELMEKSQSIKLSSPGFKILVRAMST